MNQSSTLLNGHQYIWKKKTTNKTQTLNFLFLIDIIIPYLICIGIYITNDKIHNTSMEGKNLFITFFKK